MSSHDGLSVIQSSFSRNSSGSPLNKSGEHCVDSIYFDVRKFSGKSKRGKLQNDVETCLWSKHKYLISFTRERNA